MYTNAENTLRTEVLAVANEKTKTSVRIGGREYHLMGADSAEYIHRVALYVDRKMGEIGAATNVANNNLGVLTALNIADELIKAQDECTRLRRELERMRQELSRAQKEKMLAEAADRQTKSPAMRILPNNQGSVT